jgi:hypothetical protein
MTNGLVLIAVWASLLYFSIERLGKAWLRRAIAAAHDERPLPRTGQRARGRGRCAYCGQALMLAKPPASTHSVERDDDSKKSHL